MNWKGFLKPDKIKIIITSILFTFPLILQFFLMSDAWEFGFPLPFLSGGMPQCGIGSVCQPYINFYWTFLFSDFLMLFLVTLTILLLHQKLDKISKNAVAKPLILSLALFSIYTAISLIFSIGYPLPKGRIGIGLPLFFYAYDPYSGLGIHMGPLLMLNFLLIDLIYCYIVSIIIIKIQDMHKK